MLKGNAARRARYPWVACVIVLLAAVLVPVALGRITAQVTYWGPGATAGSLTGHPSGLVVPRSYNRMYHSCASYTNSSFQSVVTYQTSTGTATSADSDSYGACRNPVELPATPNNRESWCAGNGPVQNVTCQTTEP
jgi:hypothetical protein